MKADKNKISLICPDCRKELSFKQDNSFVCGGCKRVFPVVNNVVSIFKKDFRENPIVDFYEEWQDKADELLKNSEKSQFIFKRLSRNSFYVKIRELFRRKVLSRKALHLIYDYFNKRRDFFFDEFLGDNPKGVLLDIGCGRGCNLYCRCEGVIGVDLNGALLTREVNKANYTLFVHCDAMNLPFNDKQFDYVVSSDFLEHVPFEDKKHFYGELSRVLKDNGKMAHYVTTDSLNPWFKFAHRYPDLFRKYLIEEIGGHYGLELPAELIKNIEKEGFMRLKTKKMLWEPVEFFLRFNNEYKYKSFLIRAIVSCTKRLMENDFIFVIINIPVSFLFRLAEALMPLNWSNKIAVSFKKV